MFQISKPVNTSSVNISTLRCLQRISKTELALRIEKERNLHKMEKRHRWIEVGSKIKIGRIS